MFFSVCSPAGTPLRDGVWQKLFAGKAKLLLLSLVEFTTDAVTIFVIPVRIGCQYSEVTLAKLTQRSAARPDGG